jgi:hypothetical protein
MHRGGEPMLAAARGKASGSAAAGAAVGAVNPQGHLVVL